MKKFDIVVVGELNIDLILSDIPAFPELGKEILAEEMNLVLGSSSAIFASNLASLGAKTAFIGKVGNDDFGQFVVHCLEQKGIDTSRVVRDDQLKTGITIILNYPEDRAMVTHAGAMEKLTIDDIDWDFVNRARHLHLSSFYLQKGMRRDCPTLFKQAKNNGLSTSFDTNWDPEEKWGADIFETLPHVDVFLPNEHEAQFISGRQTPKAALDKLAEYSKTTVIKRGANGAIAKQNGRIFEAAPFKVTPVDAVGAGDSFDAGFVFKYLQGEDIAKCLEFGNLCGALSVTKAGGTAAFENSEQIARDMERLKRDV